MILPTTTATSFVITLKEGLILRCNSTNSVLVQLNAFHLQSSTKVLGHFCISGAFTNSHRSNPSPHPTNNVGRVYPEFFPSFNFVKGGERENCKKIPKRMHCLMREPRNDRKI